VDAEHHLIVAHEVTSEGHDRAQRSTMAKKAWDALGTERLTALVDRGYFNAPEILECEQAGIIPLVPKPLTSNSKAEGRLDKRDFVYDPVADEYKCPAGERAIHRFATEENGLTLHKYWFSAWPLCPMKAKCTTASYRRITRWEHEHVLETMQMLLDAKPQAAVARRRTVEHVFDRLKSWLGTAPLLTKTLPRVRTEVNLAVLSYNMKRMFKIMDPQRMLQAIAAWRARLFAVAVAPRNALADAGTLPTASFYTTSAGRELSALRLRAGLWVPERGACRAHKPMHCWSQQPNQTVYQIGLG
jgi:hypothetical protein